MEKKVEFVIVMARKKGFGWSYEIINSKTKAVIIYGWARGDEEEVKVIAEKFAKGVTERYHGKAVSPGSTSDKEKRLAARKEARKDIARKEFNKHNEQ